MKKLLALCLFGLGVLESQAEKAAAQSAPDPLKDLPGIYFGQMEHHKVRIWIQKIDGETLSGMTVMRGNERPFTGTVKVSEKDGATEVAATAPGTYPGDGLFQFHYRPGTPKITGTWTYDGFPPVRTVSFEFSRREFPYDPKVGKYPEGSQRLLKKADVENRSQGELWRMRDEIYARHGLSFDPGSADTEIYFHEQDWYMPVSKDVRAEVTDLEKKNLDLIERYVHHEKMFGRRFGR